MEKKAIIMGASSGIGREVAKLLLADGWILGVAARRVDKLQNLGANYVARIDVTSDDADTELRNLITKMDGIDLYFHVAGVGKQNHELTPEVELSTFKTNGLGFARMIGEAYRYFAGKGKGQIACITSIAGTKGLGPAPSYSATKAMQNVYIQALEQQAYKRNMNIRFTDIRPGFVDTDLLNDQYSYPMKLRPEAVAHDIVRAIYKKKHIKVIDWKWCIVTALWRRIPCWIWRRMRL